jgi:hypothetical protein
MQPREQLDRESREGYRLTTAWRKSRLTSQTRPRSDAPRLRLVTRPLTTGEAEALASPRSDPFVRCASELRVGDDARSARVAVA